MQDAILGALASLDPIVFAALVGFVVGSVILLLIRALWEF